MAPRRVVVVDTETTGTSHADRVVSVAAVELLDYRFGGVLHLVFNPGRRNHWAAYKAHGLSDAFLADQPSFAEHAAEVWDFIGDAVVVGHNVGFDDRMLRQEFALAGYPSPGWALHCTMKSWRGLFPGRPSSLDACCGAFGLGRTTAVHGALEDALLCACLYQALERAPVQPMPPLTPFSNLRVPAL
ncbi:MAG: 3'-5' exoribonuclease [Caenispirillum bisanense]|nr:3'-5' exoribonuclease [Caenispirillum bisanense]MCA1973224.1 3'-5' exoribonuclease [Caenispirillum sp.]